MNLFFLISNKAIKGWGHIFVILNYWYTYLRKAHFYSVSKSGYFSEGVCFFYWLQQCGCCPHWVQWL